MSKRFVLAVAAFASVAAVFAAPAIANHSWGKYHWARTANPFTVSLGDNFTSTWDSYLNTASSDWSLSSVLDSPVVAGGTSGSSCQPTSGRVEVCNAAYGANGWLGQAQIWITRRQHIAQGTAKMNDTYYSPGSKYDTQFWRGAVVCQEIGHTYGLDHQDESGADLHTCMDYANNPDADNTHPNQHDYDQLVTIYSHLDRFDTTNALSTKPGNAPVHVARADRIRSSTIAETFADGSMRITYVVWALPSA
jgi:hypothetical protein